MEVYNLKQMNYRIYLNGGLQFSEVLQTLPCSVETNTFEVWSEQLNIYTHKYSDREMMIIIPLSGIELSK